MSVKLTSVRTPAWIGNLSRRGAGVVEPLRLPLMAGHRASLLVHDLDWHMRRLIEEVRWRARSKYGQRLRIVCGELEAALAAGLVPDPESFVLLLELFELHLRMGSVRGQTAAARDRGGAADAAKFRKLFDEKMADEKLSRLSLRERTGKAKSDICASERINLRTLNRHLQATVKPRAR
jgi:hypothetical protein